MPPCLLNSVVLVWVLFNVDYNSDNSLIPPTRIKEKSMFPLLRNLRYREVTKPLQGHPIIVGHYNRKAQLSQTLDIPYSTLIGGK